MKEDLIKKRDQQVRWLILKGKELIQQVRTIRQEYVSVNSMSYLMVMDKDVLDWFTRSIKSFSSAIEKIEAIDKLLLESDTPEQP